MYKIFTLFVKKLVKSLLFKHKSSFKVKIFYYYDKKYFCSVTLLKKLTFLQMICYNLKKDGYK